MKKNKNMCVYISSLGSSLWKMVFYKSLLVILKAYIGKKGRLNMMISLVKHFCLKIM